jgi:hypothetical protein
LAAQTVGSWNVHARACLIKASRSPPSQATWSYQSPRLAALCGRHPRFNLAFAASRRRGEPPEGAYRGSFVGPVSPGFGQSPAGSTLAHAAGAARRPHRPLCSSPNPSGLRRKMNTRLSIQTAV